MYILSDLHLEFGKMNVPDYGDELVVLAGDVSVPGKPHRLTEFLSQLKKYIYISGNHEFYNGHLDLPPKEALEKEVREFDGINFFCTTLWTNLIGTPGEIDAQRYMNDFHLIGGMNIFRWQTMFEENLAWLESQDLEGQIVVTHHAPTLKTATMYKGDVLNYAYGSDLISFIKRKKPKIWIHGHMHNSSDYVVGDTRMICNPRGYTPHSLNPEFNDRLYIDHNH